MLYQYQRHIFIFCLIIIIFIFMYSWLMDHVSNKFGKTSLTHIYELALSSNQKHHENVFVHNKTYHKCQSQDCIVLAVVCCENRIEQTKAMITSAIALSHSPLLFEIFTEESQFMYFIFREAEWPESVRQRVKINLHAPTYPPGVDSDFWIKLFKKCASLRLFFPEMLTDVDSLMYVDSDVVFLGPPERLWNHFKRMNGSHMAALVPEHEDAATGWYNRFAKHPFFGKLGVNSGVMLMNLTRLRSFGWDEYVIPVEKEFHSKLHWIDQDIINIIFHYHPDKLYVMGCEYNYRPDHCMYMNICKTIDDNGIVALHGSRNTFSNDKHPSFKAVFEAWNNFRLGESDLRQDFYYPIEKYCIRNSKKQKCATLYKQFLHNIKQMIVL